MIPLDNNAGILGVYHQTDGLSLAENRLDSLGAETEYFKEDGVILAAWTITEGRGLWRRPEGGIAYDVDLTNITTLAKEVGGDPDGMNPGKILWRLYRSEGVNFVDRLRGAFSFVLWDSKKKRMLAVTDPFGIRPMVYAESKGGFSAGSRIGILLNDEALKLTIDPEAVYHYLFFQAICSPLTIYREIRKLPPGQAVTVADGRAELFTYYDIRYQPDYGKNESYWRHAVFDAVKKAVSEHASEVDPLKTGCYLSGGTDSSSVAGFYNQLTETPAKTFSIGFKEAAFNELDYAHLASRHFGTDQHDYYVTPQNVIDLLYALPRLYDEPFGNSSVVPAYYCARLAKENGVETLLGGDGGDEIFGGNERYVQNLVFALYQRLPAMVRRKMFEPLLGKLPDMPFIYQAKRYVRRSNFPNPKRFFSYNLLAEIDAQDIFQEDFTKSIDTDCFLNLARELYQTAAPAHDTDRLLYIDMKFTITDNDLRKVTRMAEVAGVQVRYPLLDRDLVDFTATIPPELKAKWGKGRYIFKRAMEGFLPDEIIHKTKHGMGLPIAVWFKKDQNLNALLYDVLFSGMPLITEWVRKDFLDRARIAFENDETTYYGSNLWVFLVLELWLKQLRKD